VVSVHARFRVLYSTLKLHLTKYHASPLRPPLMILTLELILFSPAVHPTTHQNGKTQESLEILSKLMQSEAPQSRRVRGHLGASNRKLS